MAEDYYKRSKIKEPSVRLLAKTCLITAGNAWNRMQLQLMNKEYQIKFQQQQERQHQQHQQQRSEFVVEKTKWPQQDEGNLVNRSIVEWGYPTYAPRLDTSSMCPKWTQQHRSQPQPEDQFYKEENNGALR